MRATRPRKPAERRTPHRRRVSTDYVDGHWFEGFDRIGRDARELTREFTRDLASAKPSATVEAGLSALERLQALDERQQAQQLERRDRDREDRHARRINMQTVTLGWMALITEGIVVVAIVWLLYLAITGQIEAQDIVRLRLG
jgi:hypothetical protein